MYCKNCGTKNEDGAAFCSQCGNPLSNNMNVNVNNGVPFQQPQGIPNNIQPNMNINYPQPNKSSKKAIIAVIAVLAVVAIGGLACFAILRNSHTDSNVDNSVQLEQENTEKVTYKTYSGHSDIMDFGDYFGIKYQLYSEENDAYVYNINNTDDATEKADEYAELLVDEYGWLFNHEKSNQMNALSLSQYYVILNKGKKAVIITVLREDAQVQIFTSATID